MSREKLREAIERVERGRVGADMPSGLDIDRVIAAARAYACERCGGTTLNLEKGLAWTICPDCADYRKIADGGEV